MNKIPNSKTFLHWLLSYLIILLLPLMLAGIVYGLSLTSIRQTINSTHQASLKAISAQIDRSFDSAQEIADILLVDDSLKILSSIEESYSVLNYQSMCKLQKNIQSMLYTNKTVNNIYIYLNRTDILLNQNICYRYTGSESTSEIRFGVDTDGFYELMNMTHYADFIITEANYGKHLFLLYSYKQSIKGIPQFTVMVEIDVNELRRILRLDSHETFLFTDRQLIGSEFQSETAFNLLAETPSESRYSKAVGQFIIFQTSDCYPSISYYRVLSNTEYMAPIRKIWIAICIYVILCLLIGAKISLQITRKNYAQLEELLVKLQRVGGQIEKGSDDFQYIDQMIGRLLEESEETNRLRSAQRQARCNGILGRVLKGRQISLEQFWKECEQVGEPIPHDDNFIVAVLRIEDGLSLFSEEHEVLDNEMIDQIFMISSNIWSELLTESGLKAFMHETDGNQAALIVLPDGAQQEVLRQQAAETAQQTCRLLEEHFSVKLSAILSPCMKGIAGISEGYDMIAAVYNMRDLQGGDYPDVFSMPIPHTDSTDQLRQKAIEQLQCSNIPAAMEIVQEIISRIEEHINNDKPTQSSKEGCSAERQQSIPAKEQQLESICAYIDDHYAQSNFSLSEVSTHFSMSPSYLSQLFKKKLGILPLDYVQRRRLEKAKELLKNGTSIKDTAVAVGYYDVRPMVRAFRRYENMTPSEYKIKSYEENE